MKPRSSRQPVGRQSRLLVGREREQTLLRQTLDDMLAGQGSLVLVSGEAGIGKTTLVEWLAEKAEVQSSLVLHGGCYDLTTTPPYGPWREMIRGYVPTVELPARPNFLSDPDALAALGSQEALFDEAWQFFEVISEPQPLLLILEDLHWADEASLNLLRFVARQIRNIPMLLIATYRDDELSRCQRLAQLLPLLVRESNVVRLALTRLDQPAVSTLVNARYRLNPKDRRRLTEWLTERGGGNPFFIEELLHDLSGHHLSRDKTGQWQLDELRDVGVPSLLRQVIEGRLTRLSPHARRLVELAAVIGHEVPLNVWQEISEASDNEFRESIEEAVNASLLVELPSGAGWEFSHALVREAIYQRVPLLSRREWHKKVADVLARHENPDPDSVADHYRLAGDQRAIDWLLQSADQAERSYAWHAASDRITLALQLMKTTSTHNERRGWLLYRLGCLSRFENPAKSLSLYESARTAAQELGDSLLAACSQYGSGVQRLSLKQISHGAQDLYEAIESLERLPVRERMRIDRIGGDLQSPQIMTLVFNADGSGQDHSLDQQCELPDVGYFASELQRRGELAYALVTIGLMDEASTILGRFTDVDHIAAVHSATRDRAHFLSNAAGMVLAMNGRVADATRAFALSSLGRRHQQMPVYVTSDIRSEVEILLLPFAADDVTRRQEVIKEYLDAAKRSRDAYPSGWPPAMELCSLYLLDGDWIRARNLMATADLDQGRPIFTDQLVSVRSQLAFFQGNSDLAWSLIVRVLPNGADTRPGDRNWLAGTQMLRLAATMLLETGPSDAAISWIEAHDRWITWSGAELGRAAGALLWARYHHALDENELARQNADRALALASDPRQPLALIAVHRFLGQLDTEAGDLTQAENHLQESLRLAKACAAPFERALTLLQFAKLRAARGKSEDALELIEEVRSICEPLEAKPTLDKAEMLFRRITGDKTKTAAEPKRLTAREIQVLQHAALGLTDLEIAKNLGIGTRTVNSHMASIFNKMGVNSRAAAAVQAKDAGLI